MQTVTRRRRTRKASSYQYDFDNGANDERIDGLQINPCCWSTPWAWGLNSAIPVDYGYLGTTYNVRVLPVTMKSLDSRLLQKIDGVNGMRPDY